MIMCLITIIVFITSSIVMIVIDSGIIDRAGDHLPIIARVDKSSVNCRPRRRVSDS